MRASMIAALTVLGLLTVACVPAPPPEPVGQQVTVMSFNIHHGVGADGVLELQRIADTVARSGAGIVGLQEVDRHFHERSDFVDQATWLAQTLGMHVAFGANLDLDPIDPADPRRQYGNAVLSTYPILSSTNTLLPLEAGGEQRGLLEAVVEVDGTEVRAYSTHLQHDSQSARIAQIEAIRSYLANSSSDSSVVLLGDLNATPDSPEIAAIVEDLTDSWEEAGVGDGFTYSTDSPSVRIDYVLTSDDLTTRTAAVIASDASDHLPVSATITIPVPVMA